MRADVGAAVQTLLERYCVILAEQGFALEVHLPDVPVHALLDVEGLHLALDVYETEPLPKDSPPNTTLPPHLGGPTPDRRQDSGKLALDNIRNYLNNDPLANLVTVDAYDRAT